MSWPEADDLTELRGVVARMRLGQPGVAYDVFTYANRLLGRGVDEPELIEIGILRDASDEVLPLFESLLRRKGAWINDRVEATFALLASVAREALASDLNPFESADLLWRIGVYEGEGVEVTDLLYLSGNVPMFPVGDNPKRIRFLMRELIRVDEDRDYGSWPPKIQ